jgi:glycosidase
MTQAVYPDDSIACLSLLLPKTLMKFFFFILALALPAAFAAPGNVWHLPSVTESKISSTMRNPVYEIKAANPTIYQGFFKNGGAGGDQNGGTVNYRIVPRGGPAGSWQPVPLGFHLNHPSNADPQDQFWKAVLPTTSLAATDVVEYYITATFSGGSRETTYLYGRDGSSQTSTVEATAQASPFSIRNRPGWIFHANNRSIAENDIQVRVKTGYIGPDNSLASRWATAGAVYYTTDGSTPGGSLGIASGTSVAALMAFDGTEQDSSGNGNAALWRGTMAGVLTALPVGAQVKYRIGLWNSETNDEKFADHLAGTDNSVFVYQNGTIGQPILTVNNVNANYSISKVFVDEIAGDSSPLNIVFQPGEANVTAAEIFTNVNRRDRADMDADNDGYPDGVVVPDGAALVAGDDTQYFKAYTMANPSAGTYTLTLPAEKTGAYRLTARWKVSGDPAWRWYTNGAANRRDHAITISPKDARNITLYEINVLNIEATGDTFADRSTIEDMHNASGAPHNGNNRWDLDYLKSLGANWLWFQPIHPPARDGREPSNGWGNGGLPYEPGSPYAVKNFFEVSPIFSKNFTGSPFDNAALLNPTNRDAAMTAWQNFVSSADGKSVGIMLDAPFNHTGFDVELAQAGVDLFQPDGQTWSKTDEIRNRDARFFSLNGNYGNRASNSNNIAAGPDRFDFGKWNDVKDVFFGRYDSLVEIDSEPERSSYTSEGDWFDTSDLDWTANDILQGGQNRNITRRVWQYFARYSVHWLEKTRPAGTNRNSSTEPGLTTGQRYEWDARGIDGIRCDFGQGLPPQAWEYIINAARSKKWNYVTMSESLDGGSVTYRANRHFDILNENIVFPLATASTKNDYRNIFESRRNAYGQGLVLINNVSHDEENYSDPWEALIRFSVAATMDGTPMIFPGQELGISKTTGYNHYEVNFGKTIPHFKRFNSMQPAWSDTNFGNDQLFPVYAGMGAARNFSPSLRSSNRWFLDGDGVNSKIHAVAKYETTNASPAVKDVVLAFTNLDRNANQTDNYKIPQALGDLLGIKDSRKYNVKNIAAYLGSDPNRRNAWLWNGSGGYTGTQLKNNGFTVFTKRVPTSNETWATVPYEAQYLKVYDITPPPAPTQPANQTLKGYAIGNQVTFTWSASPSNTVDDAVTSYKLVIKTAGDDLTVFDQNVGNVTSHTYTGTLGQSLYAFLIPISAAEIEGTPSAASGVIPLLSASADTDGDGQSNGAEDTAGTNPLSGASVLKVMSSSVAGSDVVMTVATVIGKKYQLETSTTLAPLSWTNVGGVITATTTATVFTHINGAGDGKRFYQVRVVP